MEAGKRKLCTILENTENKKIKIKSYIKIENYITKGVGILYT